MKPEQYSSTVEIGSSRVLLKQLCLLGSLGFIGGTIALGAMPSRAETEVEAEIPTPAESAPAVAPVETSAELLLKPQVTSEPTPEAIAPAPTPTFEQATPAARPQSTVTVQTEVRGAASGTLIDPTDYSLGATASPDTPSLVFSDRSTGCQFTLQQGQSSPAQSCSSASGAIASDRAAGDTFDALAGNAEYDNSGFSVGPVSIGGNGLTVGGTTVISREYFNEKLRPLNLLRRGAEEFVFPLSIPSPITSLFGWRTHPIFGDRRFHTGTDLGAPEGTPVVATQDGEVHAADYMGGYGLMVILRHDDGALETRYAHLSRILVRPGEQVKQGEILGLVGSTGNSTGPHLHFELRELTAQGWVLLDPNDLMSYAVTNLVEAINNPLQALGMNGKEGGKLGNAGQSLLPYRPAQPNAN